MKNPGGQAGASAFTATNLSDNYTTSGIESQFRQAMQAAGVNYSGEIVADGKLHRFHIEGRKQSSKDGAYILHADGIPAGWFGDYKSGISQNWRADIGRELTREENEANRRRAAEAKSHHEAEIRAKQAKTAIRANKIWNLSKRLSLSNQNTPI